MQTNLDDLMPERGYRVYRNLHKQCWSLQGYFKGRGWRVCGHSKELVLFNCTFPVNDVIRQRVVATRRKEVHAFVHAKGRYGIPSSYFESDGTLQEVTYSPYTDPAEVLGSNGKGCFYIDGPMLAVGSSPLVLLDSNMKVWAQ